MDSGYNRELTISLFRDGRLLNRIVDAQKRNDLERHVNSISCMRNLHLLSTSSAKRKHVRLGYMGHLTLISEDVISALEHFPPDLRLELAKYAPQPEWDDYVGGRYHETKTKDTCLLGGGKPSVTTGVGRGAGKWRVDEAEINPSPASNGTTALAVADDPANRGEFRRTSRLTRESSADFGIAPVSHDEEDEDVGTGPPQVIVTASVLGRN